MKSIEKLRELAEDINSTEIIDHISVYPCCKLRGDWLDSWHSEFDRLCDEIEREISERYMLLPVDADGVPIHPRDEVDTSMGEKGPIGHLEYWYPNHWVAVIEYKPGQFTRYDPAAISHVKPRTIEDVLREFRFDANLVYGNPNIGGEDRADELAALVSKYADELRQIGVGE